MTQPAIYAATVLAELLRQDDKHLPLVNGPGGTGAAEIIELQAPVDLGDKAITVRYPVMHVYCERIVNSLKEKFRSFSGTADLSVEVRVTHEHAGGLQAQLQSFVAAVTGAIHANRGQWAEGLYQTGAYEVVFAPVRRGGRNFIQSARVRLEVHINLD